MCCDCGECIFITGKTPPYIIPDGYNASLGQRPVEFRCVVPSTAFSHAWFIDGESLDILHVGEDTPEERGITFNNTLIADGNITYVVMMVEARAENDNITLECLAVFRDTAPASSGEIMLYIQGDHNISYSARSFKIKWNIQQEFMHLLISTSWPGQNLAL